MKLSMWILADWLEKYHPRLEIQDGDVTISGVRFIAGELKNFPSSHVYVGRTSEVFSDISDLYTIMLVHRHDFIFVQESDMEIIINEVLAAIDYYNLWETKLWETSIYDNAFQRMVELSDDIFNNPNRIIDMSGNVWGISRKFGPDNYNERWKNTYDTGIVDLSSVSLHVVTEEGTQLSEWEEIPRKYYVQEYDSRLNYIAANIRLEGEIVIAFLIMEYATPLNRAHCQLAEVFCNILKKMLLNNSPQLPIRSKASIFVDLLGGCSLTDNQKRQLDSFGIKFPISLIVIHSIRENAPIIRNGSMLAAIRKSPAPNLSCIYEGDIVTITEESFLKQHLIYIQQMINTVYYTIGISFPFFGWKDIPLRHRQARFAVNMSKGQPGIYYCGDYAYEHLIDLICDLNYDLDFTHPALSKLTEYDRNHGTEFGETLYQYLRCERNLADTAKALFIHRNSLSYRIKRIGEIIETDLDNLDERTFILLSYKMNALKKEKID